MGNFSPSPSRGPSRPVGLGLAGAMAFALAVPIAALAQDEGTVALPEPEPECSQVLIGNSALDRGNLTYRFALDQGLYDKYGISAVDTYFDGSGKLTTAMIAGQVDVGIGTPSNVLSTLLTDAPQVMTAIYYSKMGDGLFTSGDVASADDLRGKTIAVSQLGGESHAAVLLSLAELGLTPDDVIIQQIGGQQARLAALQAGSVAAAPIDAAFEDQLTAEGFNVLVKLSEATNEFPRSGLIFTREYVESCPNAVLAITAANLEAQHMMHENPDLAVQSFMDWVQMDDADEAGRLVTEQLELLNQDLRWTPEGWEFLKSVGVAANPELENVDVSEGYTFAFLDQLKELGVNEQLGVPSD